MEIQKVETQQLSESNKSPLTIFKDSLARMKGELKRVLPPQIDADMFCRIMETTVQLNPELLAVDRRSLFATCMRAAADGLLLNGREAAAIVFNTKKGPVCQYLPMVAGILKTLRNSGQLAKISAHVVYENDAFDYELGDNERIVHKPILRGERGEAVAVYASATLKDGTVYREVMSVDDIEKRRSVSRAKDSGPWVTWWAEQAEKTVIKRLCKRLPSSADLERVLESDNKVEGFEQMKRVSAVASFNAQLVGTPAPAALPEPEPDHLDMSPVGGALDPDPEPAAEVADPKPTEKAPKPATEDLVLVDLVGGTK